MVHFCNQSANALAVSEKNNLTTAAVEWPVSVDPQITYNIPEIWDKDHPEDRITEARKYATPTSSKRSKKMLLANSIQTR